MGYFDDIPDKSGGGVATAQAAPDYFHDIPGAGKGPSPASDYFADIPTPPPPSPTPATDAAASEIPGGPQVLSPAEEKAAVINAPQWAQELARPAVSAGKVLAGQIPTSVAAIKAMVPMVTGTGGAGLGGFVSEAAKMGVGLAANMQTAKTTEPFTQQWWDAVMPVAMAGLQEAGIGLHAVLPEKVAKPPVQTEAPPVQVKPPPVPGSPEYEARYQPPPTEPAAAPSEPAATTPEAAPAAEPIIQAEPAPPAAAPEAVKPPAVTLTERTLPEGDITGTHAVDITNPEGTNIGYIGGNLTDTGFEVNISHIDKAERGKGYYQDAIQQMADKYGQVKSDTDLAPAAETAWQKVGAEKQADGSYVLQKSEPAAPPAAAEAPPRAAEPSVATSAEQIKFLNDNATVTRNGTLTQDYKTNDGVVEVKERRVGSGFTKGATVADVYENGQLVKRGIDPGAARDHVETYLRGGAEQPQVAEPPQVVGAPPKEAPPTPAPEFSKVAGAEPEGPIAALPPPETPGTQPPPVSGINNDRLAQIYGPDAVVAGKGRSAEAWKQIGQADPRDPYAVLENARQQGIAPPADVALLRTEHQRLLNDARNAYGTPFYDELAKRAVDMANAIKGVAHGPASDVFRALQEQDIPRYESPADFDNIVRERMNREATPTEKATFQKMTDEIKNGNGEAVKTATEAREKLRQSRPRAAKEPMKFADAADYIRKQIKDLTIDCAL